jgi:hypothetical protein
MNLILVLNILLGDLKERIDNCFLLFFIKTIFFRLVIRIRVKPCTARLNF